MLSEQYFKNTTWPSVENIESMINQDGKIQMKAIFLILYKEMYFRHIYASIQVHPITVSKIFVFFYIVYCKGRPNVRTTFSIV